MLQNLPRSYRPKFFHVAAVLLLFGFIIFLSAAVWQQKPKSYPVATGKNQAGFGQSKLAPVFTRGLSIPGLSVVRKPGYKKARTGSLQTGITSDTSALRKSDWFANVKKDIEKRFYYIGAGKVPDSYNGSNYSQGLAAGFTAASFSLRPLSSHDGNWNLILQFEGLSADGKATNVAEGPVAVREDKNDVEYNFGDRFAIQYHNDPSGVRQNFVIKKAPAAHVRRLNVMLQADGGWVVNKVHDHELQFARRNAHGHLDRKVIYRDLKAWDANGAPLVAKMETHPDGRFSLQVEADRAVYPVTIDPLSTAANTALTTTTLNSFLGCSVASAGDVNGDGYSDVIVGASGVGLDTTVALGVPTTNGNVYLYLGSATGLSSTPKATLTGTVSGDKFGISIASAGDVNQDGFSDIIVGASLNPVAGTARGAAYLYLGGDPASGVSLVPTVLTGAAEDNDFFGSSVSGAGDVNGDGFSDVIIGAHGFSGGVGQAYIFQGNAGGINTAIAATLSSPTGTVDQFGSSVAGAGDINGDGFADVLIGAVNGNSGTGTAYVYKGVSAGFPSAVAFSYNGTTSGDGFGASVAGAGDVNGDGYADFIIGAPGAATVGNATLYLGGTGTPTAQATITTGIVGSNQFGSSVASAGDVNGDGFADVIVGAYGTTGNNGYAYVFYGMATGILNTDSTVYTTPTGDALGFGVASAGDVNGDGYSDLIIGAPSTLNGGNPRAGAAYVFQGGPQGVASAFSAGNTLSASATSLSFSLASAGDLNSDGYGDVVIGAVNTVSYLHGAAFVFMGSSAGLHTSPDVSLGSSFSGSSIAFGWAVAGVGDVNGDGYGDLLIGSPGFNTYGEAFLYYGSSTGINNTPDVTLTDPLLTPGDAFGGSLAGVGDVNGDGYKDILIGAPSTASSKGAAYYYKGASSGTGAIATNTPTASFTGTVANGLFGAVAGAGDVNGDGYNDFMIAAPGTTTPGSGVLYIYHGAAADPTSGTGAVTASHIINAPASAVYFGGSVVNGASLSTAGDVNGDGFDDIIIGAGGSSPAPGAAYIYTGSAGGLGASPAVTLTGAGNSNGGVGTSVSGIGDVNNDGYSDVAVGAPGPTPGTVGSGPTGSAYVYTGGPGGIINTIATTLTGLNAGDLFGNTVAGAGDVNGDGVSDLIVGAENAVGQVGNAYLFAGNNALGHNTSNLLRLYETDLSTPIKQDNVNVTQFGLGLFVQPPYAGARARLVWEVEGNGTPFKTGAGSTLSTSVFTSGQGAYTTNPIPAGGAELKVLITKAPNVLATKVRVRVQYTPASFSAGQVYGPWIYTQALSTGTSTGVVLPLTWLSFTASVVGGQDVLLNWKTENEMNTRSFIVQHSTNATDYTDIGTVTAQGTQVGATSYSFTHAHPAAGTHYYRLKQVDIDANFTYSKIVTAIIDPNAPAFSVYPNPSTDHLTVVYTNGSLNMDVLRFVNVSGIVVKEVTIYTNAGNTNVPLTGLSKGVYFIQLASGTIAPKQIVIQ
ncbi:MAG: FG-GAP-like repeat-containing protein [Puia sp.]|nr:FG-GAP-like repeat-containing protein [Puia sp.]